MEKAQLQSTKCGKLVKNRGAELFWSTEKNKCLEKNPAFILLLG